MESETIFKRLNKILWELNSVEAETEVKAKTPRWRRRRHGGKKSLRMSENGKQLVLINFNFDFVRRFFDENFQLIFFFLFQN